MASRPNVSAMVRRFVEHEVYWYFEIKFGVDSDHTTIVLEYVLSDLHIGRKFQSAWQVQPLHQIGV